MPTVTPDARLFGVDLRSIAHELGQAWADALQSPLLSWLTPDAPVLLLQADGGQSLWQGGKRQSNGDARGRAGFTALQIPEDLLLRRTLLLPSMDAADLAGAVELQARTLSPFADADLLWGHHIHTHAQGAARVDIALASRKQVGQYLQAQRAGNAAPEVWAVQPGQAPIVFPGYGETARRAHAVRGRWGRCALLALALALLAGIALTPTLQLRARAIDAVGAYDGLARRTPELVQGREQFLRTADRLQALSGLLAGRIEPLRILDRLTTVLADDTALQGFVLKGNKVTLTGLTSNASAVMQVLGQQPGIRDVRAPSPAVRTGGANAKENFVVEFTLDPHAFGVATATAPAPAAVVAPKPPAPAPAPAASPAAAASHSPAVAPAGSVPVFGGRQPQKARPEAAAAQRKDGK